MVDDTAEYSVGMVGRKKEKMKMKDIIKGKEIM
jgi:hypothetical protein